MRGGTLDARRRSVAPTGLILAVVCVSPVPAQERPLPPMNHHLAGHEDCRTCHFALPESHEGRTENVCLWCHAHDSPMLTVEPRPISHEIEGREACLACHAMEGAVPVPEDHEGRADRHCLMCHQEGAESRSALLEALWRPWPALPPRLPEPGGSRRGAGVSFQ